MVKTAKQVTAKQATTKQATTAERSQPRPAEPVHRSAENVPESRLDAISGNWSIFSPQRLGRPEEFIEGQSSVRSHLGCPFCPGNESQTPPAVWIASVGDDDQIADVRANDEAVKDDGKWSVRVVANKFPAVDKLEAFADSDRSSGLFQRRRITGGHEVIIESPQHVQSLTELDVAELNLVLHAYRDRLQYWRTRPGIAYISVFKNVGSRAGASLRHSHSQLIATDRMPNAVASSTERLVRHQATTGCCLFCDLIRGEIKSRQRIVWQDDSLIAFCPFASHLPMMIRLSTKDHQPCFEDLGEQSLDSVSRLLHRAVSWLEKVRPGTAYNYCLHTAPPGMKDAQDSFHWWIDIFPRMTQVAGFEWSCQCMINPVLPEEAAARLRRYVRAEDPRRLH